MIVRECSVDEHELYEFRMILIYGKRSFLSDYAVYTSSPRVKAVFTTRNFLSSQLLWRDISCDCNAVPAETASTTQTDAGIPKILAGTGITQRSWQ